MTWRVLIAEDEFLIALDLESAFQDAGAQAVGPVRTLADALALPLDSFDAAVLDLELEDGFCYPFALKLLEAGIPFVLATGQAPISSLGDWRASPVLESQSPPRRL